MRNLRHNNYLTRWVSFVGSRPRLTLVLLGLLTVLTGWYGADRFHINSDLNKLIDQSSDWRQDFDEFERQFPDLVHTAVIAVSSASMRDLEKVTSEVMLYLVARPNYFDAMAAPGSEPYFRDRALLYMDPDTLDDTADRLAQAQPLIAALLEEPDITSMLELLQRDEAEAAEARTVIERFLVASAERDEAGIFTPSNWTDEFFALDGVRYQLIYLKPKSTFTDALPDAQVVDELRQMVASLKIPDGTRVQLTGEITLQHEEIEAAVGGVTNAGWLAVLLLFLVLLVGVRSGKIIAATFSMLAMGIVWTTAYAMFAVGEFNTLSLVFIVMFFGLGVDFALHFCLRFQESINRDKGNIDEALLESTRSVGRAITLCAVTTAIGFMGFWPTAYQGLADLGVISAGGMLIAWFLTFTYLPAFFSVFGAPRAHRMMLPTSERIVAWLLGHRTWVVLGTFVVGVGAFAIASQAKFDYSVLALKDPESASMLALRELQREQLTTDYQLVALSEEPLPVDELLSLSTVSKVGSVNDLVPQAQDQKLPLIEDMGFMYWDLLSAQTVALQPSSGARIREALSSYLSSQGRDQGAVEPLKKLLAGADQDLLLWEAAVLTNLFEEINWLRRALEVEAVSVEQLPSEITARLRSTDGYFLNTISPEENIADVRHLSQFIEEVKGVQPNATGRPVIEWGVGDIVVLAFQQAALTALLGITLVLLVALRRIGPTVLVLGPLILAGACTFALGVLLGQSVNMASVLVLPLIFGLGVDNGIHVVDRFLGTTAERAGGQVDQLMQSSTPRAVLLSTFTTIGAFAALSISPHQGTASIGMLLSVSVGLILVFTVFILPVLLSYLPTREGAHKGV